MYQIDVPSAAAVLPASTAPGVAGYFTDGSVAGGVDPTVMPAEFMNALMLEMINVIAAGGLAPAKGTYNQMLLAIENLIEARSGNYAVDVGIANAYVIALNPALAAYAPGLTIKFRALHANTGGCTLNAGAGVVPLLRDDGTALQPNDIGLNVIVTASFDPVAAGFLVNSIVPSQLGALASLGLGQGLENDGAGGVRVKLADTSMRRTAAGVQSTDPITSVAVNQVLAAGHNGANFVATAAVTFTAPTTAGLWNGFYVPIYAKGGAVTFTPNAADQVDGHTAGQSFTLVQGQNAVFITDGAGNWWPFFKTTPPGAMYPLYINAATTVGPGTYEVDTSAGPVLITLTASPNKGDVCTFIDFAGTWSPNNMTLLRNGQTIMGRASDLICNLPGETFALAYNGTDWRLQ